METDYIEKYFHKCRVSEDILGMIDKITKGLKFFKRMDKANRRDIILSSKLIIKEPQEYIIRQDEVGSHMYIIVQG